MYKHLLLMLLLINQRNTLPRGSGRQIAPVTAQRGEQGSACASEGILE